MKRVIKADYESHSNVSPDKFDEFQGIVTELRNVMDTIDRFSKKYNYKNPNDRIQIEKLEDAYLSVREIYNDMYGFLHETVIR